MHPDQSSGLRSATLPCVLHLLCSLLVVADSVHSWCRQPLARSEQVLAWTCLGWLLASAWLLVRLQAQRQRPNSALRLLVPVLAAILALLVSEAGLRAWSALSPPARSLYAPHSRLVSLPAPGDVRGQRARYLHGQRTRTARTLRKNSERRRNVYRIVAVGGSTTQCQFLDDSEAWPQLLMDLLNARQDRRFVFAGNNGAAGHTMADHLKVVAEMPVLHHADLLVFLIGVNDLSRTLLAEGARWRQESEGRFRFEWLIAAEVPQSLPLYTRLRVWRLVLSVWRQARAVPDTGEWHQQQRSKRAASPRVLLPDLTTGAQEYRDRVQSLGRLCRSLGRRCLFLTQPTLWRAGLTPEEEGSLWFGKVGSRRQMKGTWQPRTSPPP